MLRGVVVGPGVLGVLWWWAGVLGGVVVGLGVLGVLWWGECWGVRGVVVGPGVLGCCGGGLGC